MHLNILLITILCSFNPLFSIVCPNLRNTYRFLPLLSTHNVPDKATPAACGSSQCRYPPVHPPEPVSLYFLSQKQSPIVHPDADTDRTVHFRRSAILECVLNKSDEQHRRNEHLPVCNFHLQLHMGMSIQTEFCKSTY